MRHARFSQHLPAFLAGMVISAGSIPRVTAQFAEPGLVVIHTLTGDGGGEFFGYVANRVADLDADGADDILVGAPYASFAAANTGRMYLISGASGARLTVMDGITNEYLGNAVEDAGDINGDGVHDLIGGSPGLPFSGSPGVNGRVSVYSGAPPYGLIWSRVGENLNDRFGSAVAGLHDDFNDDGLNDVLATAALYDGPAGVNCGRAYVLSGLDGSTLLTLEGLAAGGLHGTAITSMDDLDNDGLRDVAVGARNDGLPQRRGLAYIYSGLRGTAVVRACAPLASGVDLGWFFMNSLGDANADGYGDLYVSDFGDVGHGAGTGRAYLFSGADGSLIRQWGGSSAGQGFGIGRAVGDLNGDGYAELFMGA